MDSSPDGIEVDAAGNVYVANKAGVTVFKSDGKKIGNVADPRAADTAPRSAATTSRRSTSRPRGRRSTR